MIYNNQLLASLVLDAIKSYKTSCSKLYPKRKEQIDKLQSLCFITEYDSMLESGVMALIREIRKAERGWFFITPSRFADLLQKALDQYQEMVYYAEVQGVLFEQISETFGVKPKMPSQAKIVEEADSLARSSSFVKKP